MTNIPHHVAIIMDGNGRWAKKKGLPKIVGHRAGIKSVEEAIKGAKELGVKILTLYTFSTENWKRPKYEVNALFKLLENYIDKELDLFDKNDIRLSAIGRMEGLPRIVREKLIKAIDRTKDNKSLILNIALNYGSRQEIVDAVRKILKDYEKGLVSIESIDEKTFSDYLYTKCMPDPDLLIRTSGEMRVSNFLLWQISYAEIYVTKKLWPDFRKSDFKKAIREYSARDRRYGG
ncbi:MAG: di-trans,poly-cis-decaprenylcistransferase [Omnitrophica bacterium RIFCSPHIGHO2_02_FULL_46_20]|nr:MAG: di-trans,poly-cis-decaprenylcistransferase [Omnitrophica bacterium RIFCSPHIGHO2_02_FULL_46_20]